MIDPFFVVGTANIREGIYVVLLGKITSLRVRSNECIVPKIMVYSRRSSPL